MRYRSDSRAITAIHACLAQALGHSGGRTDPVEAMGVNAGWTA
jgi:hypothetical protein